MDRFKLSCLSSIFRLTTVINQSPQPHHRLVTHCLFPVYLHSVYLPFAQDVYLRRRAVEALGRQGPDVGAIGALALKRAAQVGLQKPASVWICCVFLFFVCVFVYFPSSVASSFWRWLFVACVLVWQVTWLLNNWSFYLVVNFRSAWQIWLSSFADVEWQSSGKLEKQ